MGMQSCIVNPEPGFQDACHGDGHRSLSSGKKIEHRFCSNPCHSLGRELFPDVQTKTIRAPKKNWARRLVAWFERNASLLFMLLEKTLSSSERMSGVSILLMHSVKLSPMRQVNAASVATQLTTHTT